MLSLTTCIYAEHECAAVIIGCDRNWSQVWLICSSSSLSIPTTLLQFEPCLKQTHLFRFTIHILCSIGTSWRCILLHYPENYNYRLLSSLLIMNVEAERINRTNLFHGNVWNFYNVHFMYNPCSILSPEILLYILRYCKNHGYFHYCSSSVWWSQWIWWYSRF